MKWCTEKTASGAGEFTLLEHNVTAHQSTRFVGEPSKFKILFKAKREVDDDLTTSQRFKGFKVGLSDRKRD